MKKQKLFAIIIIAEMLMALMPMKFVRAEENIIEIFAEEGSCPESHLLGDLDFDGLVSSKDAKLLARHVSNIEELSEKQLKNADMNQDQEIKAGDITIISRIATVGWNDEYSFDENKHNYISNNVIAKGKSIQLMTSSSETVEWKSSDNSIATVDNTGKVTMLGKGYVKIEATSVKNGVTNKGEIVLYGIEDNQVIQGTGIKLEGDSITTQNTSMKLTVNSDGMEKGIVGFSAEVRMNPLGNVLVGIESVVSETEGWKVTGSKFENNILKMTVEAMDISDENEISKTSSVTVRINVNTNQTSDFDWASVSVNPATFKRTDIDNNSNMPLEGYKLNENGNFGIVLNKIDVDKINYLTVKKGKEENAFIIGRNIFVKLDGSNNGENANATMQEFLDCFNEDFNKKFVKWDFVKNPEIVNKEKDMSKVDFEGTVNLSLYISSYDLSKFVTYNVYELGDVYLDSSYGINVNDVMSLRKAIIGVSLSEINSENGTFRMETTDVNNSNISEDGKRNLGDIGDVISIRQRILFNKWKDKLVNKYEIIDETDNEKEDEKEDEKQDEKQDEEDDEIQYGTWIQRKDGTIDKADGTVKGLKIGDYINYDPTAGLDTTNKQEMQITSFKEDNGYIDQTFDLRRYTGEKKWRLLGVKDGNLELIATDVVPCETREPINTIFYLKNLEGFQNAEIELNKVSSLYGKGKYAIGGRSVNVDDINKITGYNPNAVGIKNPTVEQIENGEKYAKGKIFEYGNEVTYSWDGTEYLKYSAKNGKNGKLIYSHNVDNGTKGFIWFDFTNNIWKKSDFTTTPGDITTITSTEYSYYPETLTSKKDETATVGLANDSIERNLIFGKNYWLASKCVLATDSIAIRYGIRSVTVNAVDYDYMVHSNGAYHIHFVGAIRPVVTLSPDIQLEKDNVGGIWNII